MDFNKNIAEKRNVHFWNYIFKKRLSVYQFLKDEESELHGR
jgi:hypothetical protein